MKQRMPYADLGGFEANPEVDKLLDLYAVDMLEQYVSSKLSAGVPERAPTDGPRCGRKHEVTPATPRTPCSAGQAPRQGGRPHTHIRRRIGPCDGSGSISSWSSGAASSPGRSRT